jgi:pimeloyl-ACP methyl ester carboxylesterase
MKGLALVSIALLLLAAAARAEQRQVSITAGDGFALQGSYSSAEKGGPGILLLHQCDADRRVYDQLATMLNVAGYNVLTFDWRGSGRSDSMPGDVDAALKFLAAQPTVISRAIGVVGGSCGVNQAVQASRRHPEIRTLVLLSGGTDAQGEAHIKSSATLPIFGVASEEDTAAAAAIRKIVGLSTHPDSRTEMFKGAGHAAAMFAKQQDLEADIVIWFRANLPVAGYGLPPAIR